ncbi:DNA_pol_A_exo1 domain-containing protein [Cephalotus follicularis]|uniref:DNA_pol_A_exo1 domain-containing protein n=1 Tax=Cephalotus follicularis TaxID=3775 RepID=A0A1Q3D9E9_CEPFO|nr:DNA_pol_A_exo1 domain-containing protein [Cephalotus follicularis]
MTITIFDHELPDYTHNMYDITLDDFEIQTLLTHCPSKVESWLIDTQRIHRRRLNNLIVGLDVEWRPNHTRNSDNPIATLQLCVGHRCLVFQIIHSPSLPQSLAQFLANDSYTFVGVGIRKDVEKLEDDYQLRVGNAVDLRRLVEEEELKNCGLKALARSVLGIEVEKPKSVTMSMWDNQWLTPSQVKYASVDAFLSFEIGRRLNASGEKIVSGYYNYY